MPEKRFCVKCGCATTDMNWTADGMRLCNTCHSDYLRRQAHGVREHYTSAVKAIEEFPVRLAEALAQAKADAAAEQAKERVPVSIIARARSIDRSERSLLVDRIGQIEHDAWEAGYEAAVRIARQLGATAVADDMESALADYWETQGIERELGG